ncbi:MAG: DUF2269 domain-containing protein [Gammaproteobacteria bacterium]|nr:DUF2269 domain-containing protein [Gammaproteobacteria bacterium]
MDFYLGVKLLHILSATLLFGTGLGTAFFMYRAYRSENVEAMKVTTENVVLADWVFTTPAIVVQILSGVWLTQRLGISYNSVWFVTVIGLFCLVGACWTPVVWIQIKVRNLIRQNRPINEYKSLMSAWIALGIPAFLSVLVLFVLMVYRPWTQSIIFAN